MDQGCFLGEQVLSGHWREILPKIEMNNSSGWGEPEWGNKEV